MSATTRAQLRRATAEQQEVARLEKEDAVSPTPLKPTNQDASESSSDPPLQPTDPDVSESSSDPPDAESDADDTAFQDLSEMDLPPFQMIFSCRSHPRNLSPRARSVWL